MPGKVALYANVGAVLTHYDVDVEGLTLTTRESVTLPAGVQYAWPHVSRRYLYVATSSSASGYGPAGTEHHVSAFRIDPASGALTPHGEPIPLPTRPIHMTTDIPSEHVLVAFNNPSSVRVYRINGTSTLGRRGQAGRPIDAGIFAHQVRVTPDNKLAILVTRGNEGTPGKARRSGRAQGFRLQERRAKQRSVDRAQWRKRIRSAASRFPSDQAMDVRVDRNAEQDVHVQNGRRQDQSRNRLSRGDARRAENIRARQAASTVHVHPNGRFLYGSNRAQETVDFQGKKVFKGGENSIVVYSINQTTGEPTQIQNIETRMIHPRTFHIDPSGRMLVAQHNLPVLVREGNEVKTVSAGLSVFRIGDDGKLDFLRKYDVDVGDKLMFWMGMVPL